MSGGHDPLMATVDAAAIPIDDSLWGFETPFVSGGVDAMS